MSLAVTSISFGEWLPDQSDLNRGGLITAKNVLSIDDGFAPFKPLDNSLFTVPALVEGAAFAFYNSTGYVYAHSPGAGTIYSSIDGLAFTARSASTLIGHAGFAQFDDLMLISFTQHVPFVHTIGSASNVSPLSAITLPKAGAIGVVNRFAVIGNLNDGTFRGSSLRWSAIDDPANWPVANSATAIATQAGEQDLNSAFGNVNAIHGGDQYAIILQRNAVVRMTYVGPPVVFQFDTIDKTLGSRGPRTSIRVGNIVYFISDNGICRTDGVTVERIGKGKVDRYFLSTYKEPDEWVANCGYDPTTGLVYFGYSTSSGSFDIDRIIIFNPATNQFTFANQDMETFVTPIPDGGVNSIPYLLGFGNQSSSILGMFQGTPGSAILESSDFETNPGGRGFISGVKPNVESSGTPPTIGVRIGYRDDLGTSPTYTATTAATTSTGFADFRVDAKYTRAEVNIVGNFDKVSGFVANAGPSSSR